MDSVTQFVLGAAVAVAASGRHAPVRRVALWGGICGTLPDLDVFFDRGDPIQDMILHRTESHALFYLTLAAPILAALINRLHGERRFARWWLAIWLALITHPLLDLMTVYGTQLGLPFTREPFYIGSVFVIDPVVTIALAIGVIVAIARTPSAFHWNAVGLGVAVCYLGWGVVAQAKVRETALVALQRAGIPATAVLVTPAPFNSVLWRIVAMTPDVWYEGSRSLLDSGERIEFVARPTGHRLHQQHADDVRVQRVAWFSHGFFDIAQTPAGLRLRDLRMGYGDNYVFSFVLPPTASATAAGAKSAAVIQEPRLVDLRAGLPWLWHRLLGNPSPFPTGAPARPGQAAIVGRQTATVSAPSMTRLAPEIRLATAPARNTTPAATSSAVPSLPVGLALTVEANSSGLPCSIRCQTPPSK